MYWSTLASRERSGRGSALTNAGSRPQGAQGRCVLDVREVLWNAADEVPHPAKTRVLTRKAHGADVRGAGLWPTGVHEAPWNAAREVPPPTKSGF